MGSSIETASGNLVRSPNTGLSKEVDPFIQDRIKRIKDLNTWLKLATPDLEKIIIERKSEDGKPSYRIGKVSLMKRTLFGFQWEVVEYLARTQGIQIGEARKIAFREFENNEPGVPPQK